MPYASICRSRLPAAGALSLAITSCAVLDTYGMQEDVIETDVEQRSDDLLSDKRPEYDPELTIREWFGHGCEFTLNKSAAVTRLTLVDLDGDDQKLDGKLFPTRAAALEALGSRVTIPSMEVVNGALKPFNDGLYAAVELLAEGGGSGALVNKAELFDDLLSELLALHAATPGDSAAQGTAADFAAAALLANRPRSGLPAAIEAEASKRAEAFYADPFLSRPIGFYAWTPELETIFRRDRLLMYAAPGASGVTPMVAVLGGNPSLVQSYGGILALYAGLTNPALSYSPLDVLASTGDPSGRTPASLVEAFIRTHADYGEQDQCLRPFSWLPPSTSPEAELGRRMACSDAPTRDLLEAFILAIQSGAIDLTPTEDSGWYAHQLYALETLLLPERAKENSHLLLTREYKERLVETFKSLLIQTRETHVKGLAGVGTEGGVDPTTVELYPLLPVEPFPTFYLRTARAYAFVERILVASLGTTALENTSRLIEGGTRATVSLADELAAKTRLLYGLHLVAAASIGMRPELSEEELANVDPAGVEAEARAWLGSWQADRDVLRDPRVIVPIARDEAAGTVAYWAVAGVKVLRMRASYPEGYEPQIVESTFCQADGFVPFEPYLLVEQAVGFSLPADRAPLTRDEFRGIADDTASVDELLVALGATD